METSGLIGVGDHAALDLLNSTAVPGRDRIELLVDGTAYVDWLELVGLIDDDDKQAVTERFSEADLDAVGAAAVELREWLRPIVADWAVDSALPAGVVDHLNRILATDHRYARISADAGVLVVHDRREWRAADQLLVPTATAIAQLLTAGDRHLIRNCEGPTCSLWFYDRTKSHRRRWCSMAVCGNREKARIHRERVS